MPHDIRYTNAMPIPRKHLQDLYKLLSLIKDEKDAKLLLDDLLTPHELETIAERWQLIRELATGKPQRQIAKELGVSITKITKGSRVLKYGGKGFTEFLGRK